jgi:hypothetical protein
VPKQEISHRAGHRLEEKLRQFLGQFFSDSELERVERLGGRITISMAVSDTQRRKKGEHVVIDEALVKELETLRNSPDDFHTRLRRLTVSELQQLSVLVGHPNRPAATAAEMRAALLRHFQSDDVWRGIAGPRASE